MATRPAAAPAASPGGDDVWAALTNIFADMDADESSEVDLGELRDAMLRAGFFGAVVDDDSLQKWFDEADLDVNGRVSFSEFARISVSGLVYFGSDHAGESE